MHQYEEVTTTQWASTLSNFPKYFRNPPKQMDGLQHKADSSAPNFTARGKGYLCLLANDPEHRVATTEGEAMRLVPVLD